MADPEKPLPRAAKGTIRRAAANALYTREIDQLYTSDGDLELRGNFNR